MRRCIRQAWKEGYERLAVVCGAWHRPAPRGGCHRPSDAKLLTGSPQGEGRRDRDPLDLRRLAPFQRLRGRDQIAQVVSPPLERFRLTSAIRWMTRVASLMRVHDLDASAAHVIEAVRLAGVARGFARPPFARPG